MKKVKMLTIALLVILVTVIAVCGIYIPHQNRMENEIKDYSYGMDLKGARNVTLVADTSTTTIIKDKDGNEVKDAENLTDEELTEKGYIKEETKNNNDNVLNEENYKKSKQIIEERLKKIGVQNYEVRLDGEHGNIMVAIPENDATDDIVGSIGTTGKFEIVDSQTNEVLMDNKDIEKANVMYGQDPNSSNGSGTMVYLSIVFNKDGAKKLEDISGKYVTTSNKEENTTSENEEAATEEKKITMKIDGETIMSTSFEEPLRTGELQLSVGASATDQKTLQGYIIQATNMATVLDTGNMPIKYTVDENKYILSDITKEDINTVFYVIAGITAIALVVLIVRYKTQGVIGVISYIGLAAVLSLILRYTNVVITIEGIVGIIIALILNYIFVNKLLAKLKNEKLDTEKVNESLKQTYKEFFARIIPICIAVIAFCFMNWEPISSFGMVMFWGIVLIAGYNIVITNILLKLKADDAKGETR